MESYVYNDFSLQYMAALYNQLNIIIGLIIALIAVLAIFVVISTFKR